MTGVPIVREITEAEYWRRRAEMNRRQHADQRARVAKSLVIDRKELRDVYPRRQEARKRV